MMLKDLKGGQICRKLHTPKYKFPTHQKFNAHTPKQYLSYSDMQQSQY